LGLFLTLLGLLLKQPEKLSVGYLRRSCHLLYLPLVVYRQKRIGQARSQKRNGGTFPQERPAAACTVN
ncbi:MAG: hypothetical protein LBG73_05965, partial [Spirochaetaceae bacterium]|nr:hypothetical protein [Spirochaetaceae bacterium]